MFDLIPNVVELSGLVAQAVEEEWSKSESRGFDSHPGQRYSLPLREPISLPWANVQIA